MIGLVVTGHGHLCSKKRERTSRRTSAPAAMLCEFQI